ncbi:MAG: serine protease [Kordiimonadaceae bacterium]|nr:serine protease [Kordiimonadaceae bacterium]
MRIFISVCLLFLLAGCGAGGFGSSYKAYMDPLMSPDVIALGEEEEPNLLRSNDLDHDVTLYREHNYVVVGESAFNGIQENQKNALKQAKNVGATHVIVTSEYTDTQSHLAYDYQDYYRTIYVNKVRSVNGKNVRVNEAVTIRDTVAVPYTRFYDNYDQAAVYLVKSARIRKLGLLMRDLSPAERNGLRRNTGAYIDLVLSNSPSFFANILPQDVLINVNGTEVLNRLHAEELISGLEFVKETIVLSVLSQGVKKDITLEFQE